MGFFFKAKTDGLGLLSSFGVYRGFMWAYFKSVFLRPHLGLNKELANPSLVKAFQNYVWAGVISSVVFSLAFALDRLPLAFVFVYFYHLFSPAITLQESFWIFNFVSGVVFNVVLVGLLFVFVKLAGGKGTFTQLLHGFSLVAVPLALLSVLVLIPLSGYALYSLVIMLAGLYALYFQAIVLKRSQQFSTERAVGVYALYFLTIVILMVVVGFLLLFYLSSPSELAPSSIVITKIPNENLMRYESNAQAGFSFVYPADWNRVEGIGTIPFFNSDFLNFVRFNASVDSDSAKQDQNASFAFFLMPPFGVVDSSLKESIVSCDLDVWKKAMQSDEYNSFKGMALQSAEYRRLENNDYCLLEMVPKSFSLSDQKMRLIFGICNDKLSFVFMASHFDSFELLSQQNAVLESFSC